MIRVEAKTEPPEGFAQHVQDPGYEWLRNPVNRSNKKGAKAYWNEWRPCRDGVEAMFEHRCGYAACYITTGQVEHFISWKKCKESDRHELAYEWSNYRWILAQLNGRKGKKGAGDVLDPFEVCDAWFELHPLTLKLRLVESEIPHDKLDVARATRKMIEKDDLVANIRREAVTMFEEGTPLAALEHRYPQVHRALQHLFDAPESDLAPEFLAERRRLLERHRAAIAADPHAPPTR